MQSFLLIKTVMFPYKTDINKQTIIQCIKIYTFIISKIMN